MNNFNCKHSLCSYRNYTSERATAANSLQFYQKVLNLILKWITGHR